MWFYTVIVISFIQDNQSLSHLCMSKLYLTDQTFYFIKILVTYQLLDTGAVCENTSVLKYSKAEC